MNERPHWIVRVVHQVSDPAWWDGLNLGLAAAAVIVVAVLAATGAL